MPWSSFRKLVTWQRSISLLPVVLVGFLAYDFSAFVASTRSYREVRVTDTRADVLYRLGYPPIVLGKTIEVETPFGNSVQEVFYTDGTVDPKNAMPESAHINDYDGWEYPEKDGTTTSVNFDQSTGNVESIECLVTEEKKTGNCPPLLTIHVGDAEDMVLSKLGSADRQKLDGVSKTLGYDDVGAEFRLTKGEVYALKLLRQKGSLLSIGQRFVKSTLP